MKKASLITVLVLGRLLSFAQNIEFAEISFYQDSVNPMTIHLVCKVKSAMYTTFALDEEAIIWGDGTQSIVHLTDTSFEYPGFISADPLKTYELAHTYANFFEDSMIHIGLSLQSLTEYIGNATSDPAYNYLCPIANINFAYMKNYTGISPPHFSSYTFLTDTALDTLDFYPQIVYDSSYTLKVEMIGPNVQYPHGTVGGILPIQYSPFSPYNIVTFDSSDGHLIWATPLGIGGDMISYTAAIYQDSIFVCSMTRDFMVDVFAPDTNTNTGIRPLIVSTSSLKCYPSPTSGSFTIDMTGYGGGEKQISIYDQLGQVVYQTHTSLDKLQVSDKLSSGIYTVSVTQDSRREYARIVVE